MSLLVVLFFGPLSDLSGRREMELPDGVRTVSDLALHLGSRDPDLAVGLSGSGVCVAVNRKFASEETLIGPGDEIAFMSPMSGG